MPINPPLPLAGKLLPLELCFSVFDNIAKRLGYSAQWGFPGGASGKEPACQCRRYRDVGLVPGLGRSPGGGHGNPLQYPCLENPMDRGAWQSIVHGVAELDTTEHSTMIF